MDVRGILDSEQPYSFAKEHWVGIVFALLLATVVVVFTMIVVLDAIEVFEWRASKAALQTEAAAG